MNNDLLILGAGQYGMVAREVAEAIGCFDKIDFLDDNNTRAIDRLASYELYPEKYSYAVVAIGNPAVRLSYINKLKSASFHVATLISPRAYIAPSVQMMEGTIVEPMAVVNANSAVGVGVIICAGAIVNHNATIGDGCLLQCGSIVEAGVCVPAEIRIDYNEVFRR